jgi:hypothetical protein
MALSATITGIRRPAGSTHLEWSDGGHFQVMGGLPELKDAVRAKLDEAKAEEFLKWLLLACFLKRFPNPTLGQINGFLGTTIAIDLTSNAPITITPG